MELWPLFPDDWTPEDIIFSGMKRAIEISRNCKSEPDRISPKVGAVVIKGEEIVLEAYRGETSPGDHAEYVALEKKERDFDLEESILITTLEPCTSRKPTKIPCAKRVVDAGIKSVWIGMLDPNPKIRTDIADDVGLSSKTVRKHLDRMIENKLASFTIQWMPHKNSFVMVFHIILNEGTDMNSTLQHINEKYSQNIAYCLNYSNFPNLITLHTWAKNAQDAQKIQEELQTEGFKDVIPHIFIDAEWFDCWVDRLLRTK